MADPIDRFLRHRPAISPRSPLGRVYGVTRQSWRLEDDPAKAPRSHQVIATGKSASDAAEIARVQAAALARTGFHKPSGAWWGVKDGQFHRFVVAPRSRRRTALALTLGMVGLFALAVSRRRKGA